MRINTDESIKRAKELRERYGSWDEAKRAQDCKKIDLKTEEK
jgi:hypothetical protein